jgi:aspartate/methionine/tyrosine aminotransferase
MKVFENKTVKMNGKMKMKAYSEWNKKYVEELYKTLLCEYNEYKRKGLSLDLSRGKPNSEHLDMSQGILQVSMTKEDCISESGFDCRNYGLLDGVPEVKRFFSELFNINESKIIVGGNSSLQLMYSTLSKVMLFGLNSSKKPWCREDGLKWICVAPGYDRHFRITEQLGFELLTVKMTENGPDMDEVERLVKDEKVKGIWCIPKYSNPSGNTYSDEVVERLAKMECAADDFMIMWDNAYGIHDIDENGDTLADIFSLAEKYGHGDRVFYYTSTSKVTFPGAGVAMMACSDGNIKWMKKYLGAETIGYDKLNQLRHLRYFKNVESIRTHMKRLGENVGRKFKIALSELDSIKGLGLAKWTEPKGGYFITLNTEKGTAQRIFNLMSEAGVTLTNIGATHPYGIDHEDSTIRLAPTYPTDEDLSDAMKILVLSIKIASIEKFLNK